MENKISYGTDHHLIVLLTEVHYQTQIHVSFGSYILSSHGNGFCKARLYCEIQFALYIIQPMLSTNTFS